ncbi:MAG: pyruvate formate-lyase [Opitutales bacterium]|nr:pyruvate formate-lyase [Opitutales bacterium]
MNERIQNLKQYIVVEKRHHALRRSGASLGLNELAEDFRSAGMSAQERAGKTIVATLNAEIPVILPNEKIVFTRTLKDIPEYFTQAEWDEIKANHFICEKGEVFNLSADYERILNEGLDARKATATKLLDGATDEEKIFLNSVIVSVEALQDLIDRYALEAEKLGEQDIAQVLRAIRGGKATSFREALQLLRIMHFSIWIAGNYHNTLGRLDQYLYPFYSADIDNGKISKEEAFDLLEEFFLACNKDSDLYIGMQQGDNGQSVVLGGRSLSGEYMFNEISEMALQASYELALIDPKINIRVDSKTPLEIFEKGSELTKIGLGFPQYSNDDIVIPSLIEKGYAPEDAHEYVVAACWEFIIPKYALDIPNIDALSLSDCITATLPDLPTCATFEDYYALVEKEIQMRANAMLERHKNIYIKPAPLMSLMSDCAVERKRDISYGMKYNNYGIHGTGVATATDSLSAIKKYCFDEKIVSTQEMVNAVEANFEGYENLQKMLRTQAPKMGTDDDYADSLATRLLDSFGNAFKDFKNERGGCYRAGTGTAMYYVFHGKGYPATPDGRNKDEVIPANYSPSLFLENKGPMAVVKSFAKPNLKNVANGGPLTLEFDSSVFRNEESVRKLAMLVRTFIVLGGHQLQLNTVNRAKLLDAKANPENYRSLIVRVWGWSGYFVELDECYQDHVIARTDFIL